MEPNPNPPPIRGRARGRSQPTTPSTTTPSQQPQQPSPPTAREAQVEAEQRQAAYSDMFTDDQGRKRRHSSEEGGSNGNGNGDGSSSNGKRANNGSGNGSSDNGSDRGRGVSPADSGRGGRGGSGGSPGDNGRGGRGALTGDNGGTGAVRGGLQPQPGNGNGEQFATDYVRTRPTADFVKKGSSGREVKLISNYYVVDTHPKFKMALYVVRISPEVEEERKIRALVRSKRDELGPYMLSGFQMFTTMPVKEELLEFHMTLEGDEIPYQVNFDFKRNVPVSDPLVLQFHNILVRQIQRGLKYEMIGRHYFDHTKKRPFDNWKLELWPGFQNSIRQQEVGLMLNVENVWKVVKTENVFQMMSEIRQREGAGPGFERQCNQAIIGLSVITKYNRRAYKIDEIDFGKSPSDTFPKTKRLPGGREETIDITFADYYKSKHDVDIRMLRQPLLVSKPTKRDQRRGQVNDILLVPELCYPCGLNEELRSNFRLMKDLASCLHMEPTARVSTMRDFVRSLNNTEEVRTTLRNWGVRVKNDPVEFMGRALPPQDLVFANGNKITGGERADWTMGLRNVQMLSNMALEKWAVVVTSRDSQSVNNVISTMQRVATPLGYRIRQPEIIRINDNRADSYLKGITQAMDNSQGKLDMVFIVLGNNNLDTYSQVKKRCSRDYGVPSQCFLSKNLAAKGLMSICTKMVIQMNTKQGGEPWGINNPMKNIMVLGYDVHHAGAGGGISVGAMTATVNPTLGRYYSTIDKLPAERQEIASTVAKMFDKCLRAYAKINGGQLPGRVIMYRDGVGEGQLWDVKETEVTAMQEKIKVVYEEMKKEIPKFIYLIVNKRINTRLFQGGHGGNYNNPLPGLVVDDVVTRPERYDFFLISQTARQGCVSPTYYNVIHDTSDLTPEKVQMFTYRMCHMYYNWSGTVAVPGPCQNAHKYALQAGTAMKGPANQKLDYLLHFL